MKIPDFETLEEAKEWLRIHWYDGVPCPCCKQMVKLYPRKIYSTMARNLINLYKLDFKYQNRYFFHISEFCPKHPGDFAKLVYWGLVEEEVNEKDSKRTSGMWAITESGRDFVRGEISVIEYKLVFNKEVRGTKGQYVRIKHCLGKDFNYEELMND